MKPTMKTTTTTTTATTDSDDNVDDDCGVASLGSGKASQILTSGDHDDNNDNKNW